MTKRLVQRPQTADLRFGLRIFDPYSTMANAIENRVFSDELPVEDVGFPVPGWASKRVQ